VTKTLLVYGTKTFKIEIPEDAKVTFGPWSPPTNDHAERYGSSPRATGTLRIYRGTKDNIVALFAGVTGFRDLSLEYAEEVAKEEGATIWKSDQHGYEREEKVQRTAQWVDPVPLIDVPTPDPARLRARRKKA